MINRIYRLVGTKKIEVFQRELDISENMPVIKPDYLSICAADQRYYFGKRPKEILKKKLPMALIHEGIGTVVYDKTGAFKEGTKVVMIPNVPGSDTEIKENYALDSKFMSSSKDGFMQDFLQLPSDRLIELPNDNMVYVLSELMSVTFNAIDTMGDIFGGKKNIGIWGDGKVGYATAIILHCLYPQAKIYVFGIHRKKLQYFSFADYCFETDEIPDNLQFDICFECVGGMGSADAIEQIITYIKPQGHIALLGVSEQFILMNTRMILEKGINFVGCSRSGKNDFENAVKLLAQSSHARAYMENIISEVINVESISDIHTAFESDCINDFKTVLKWMV